MNSDTATGEENDRSEDTAREGLTDGTVELRLPPKAEFLPVLRATVGVVAGRMSFNYDDVIQLRVAASEAFGMAVRHLSNDRDPSTQGSVAVRLVVGPGELSILVEDPTGESDPSVDEDLESRAVLESLVDKVELGVETAGERAIKLVKRRPIEGE